MPLVNHAIPLYETASYKLPWGSFLIKQGTWDIESFGDKTQPSSVIMTLMEDVHKRNIRRKENSKCKYEEEVPGSGTLLMEYKIP